MSNNYSKRDWQSQPPYRHEPYVSTKLRGPGKPLVPLQHTMSETTGPVFGPGEVDAVDADLTRNAVRDGDPLGERIIVTGCIRDDQGKSLPGVMIEVWQANAAGRYIHKNDQHDAPIDRNFIGAGRCLTDERGQYSFTTIKPGAYPWGNHSNAWRPPHIHFSILGQCIATRLVTQMYFPGDPLLEYDPIFNSVAGDQVRQRLVSRFSMDATRPGWALGYEFDIVLRGREKSMLERDDV